jgi:PRTRC genetic system protein E
MTFFQRIKELTHNGTVLSFVFTAIPNSENLSVVVSPISNDVEKAGAAMTQSLAFEATVEELETEFADALGSFSASRKSLSDAVKNAEVVMGAAKQEAISKASKAVKGAAKWSEAAKPVPADTPTEARDCSSDAEDQDSGLFA